MYENLFSSLSYLSISYLSISLWNLLRSAFLCVRHTREPCHVVHQHGQGCHDISPKEEMHAPACTARPRVRRLDTKNTKAISLYSGEHSRWVAPSKMLGQISALHRLSVWRYRWVWDTSRLPIDSSFRSGHFGSTAQLWMYGLFCSFIFCYFV